MPRRKKTAADAIAAITGPTPALGVNRHDATEEIVPPTTEDRLESLPLPDPDDVEGNRIAARVLSIATLVLAAEEEGVPVPLPIRKRVPSPAEIVREYHRLHAIEADAKRDLEVLKTYVLAYLDRPSGPGVPLFEGEGGYGLKRTHGMSAAKISAASLVEQGVDPDVIEFATVPGTPYFQVRVVEPKAVAGGGDE